ncbi:MAG: fibronectin type III domain-containing protein, partial [Deltaproteobacteria bacterium]|nr:fibronectin type III domain-containing protein [Deltaproteobacteria bacterium]
MAILIIHILAADAQRIRKAAIFPLVLLLLLFIPGLSWAGPYSPAAGQPGSSAVAHDDPAFIGWAGQYLDYLPGDEVEPIWMNPVKALGPAGSEPQDIVSLGRGGRITLVFDPPVMDGPGWDFAVFENSFSDTFLELAHVEVSSNGTDFIRFHGVSLTAAPVVVSGNIDPTDIDKLAGRFRQGFGAPFDLRDLADAPEVLSGTVDLTRISQVRLVDIIGDGTDTDSAGRIIYDPYPTFSSAGFDLDALGIRYENIASPEPNVLPGKPAPQTPADGSLDTALALLMQTDAFSDANSGDIHLRTTWQISAQVDFSGLAFELSSAFRLTSLTVPGLVLRETTTYYWRVQFFDNHNTGSGWSDVFSFTTGPDTGDLDKNGLPDDQEAQVDWDGDGAVDTNVPSVNAINSDGITAPVGVEPGSNILSIDALRSIDPTLTWNTNRPENLPVGLIGFKARVADSDLSAYVTVHFSEPVPEGAKWYKYDLINGWREYGRAVFSLDRRSVTLEFRDGDPAYGDVDGLKNGIVVDPGGVGSEAVPVPPPDDPAGFGNGGGCFISTVFSDREKAG